MYCCEDHIELAIDMYVDDKELAPEIEKIDNNTKLSTTCELCEKPAIYIVGTNIRPVNVDNTSSNVDNF